MNRTNWEHAAWALLLMAAVWIAAMPVVDWLVAHPEYIAPAFGATVGSIWFIAREHTQAEDRYLANYGFRLDTPAWPEIECLHPDNWNRDSMLDWIVPALVVWLVAWVAP